MEKRKITEDMIQYIFEPIKAEHHFGNSILALIYENQVLLIDTGYEDQALEVYQDLKDHGLSLSQIIISHFHDDHMDGLKVLPSVPVYGSADYYITLNRWNEKDDHHHFKPTNLVEEPLDVLFGQFNLKLIPLPGHSDCGLLITINDRFVHVGDELMFSNDGEAILPCLHGLNDVRRKVHAIKKLRDYTEHPFILGHGGMMEGEDVIVRELDNRLFYLEAILNHKEPISYKEAVKKCEGDFVHREWFKFVYN